MSDVKKEYQQVVDKETEIANAARTALDGKPIIPAEKRGEFIGSLKTELMGLRNLYNAGKISIESYSNIQVDILALIQNSNDFTTLENGLRIEIRKIKESTREATKSILVEFTKSAIHKIMFLDEDQSKNGKTGNFIMGMTDSLFALPEFIELLTTNSQFRRQAWEALKNINMTMLTDEVNRLIRDASGDDTYKQGRASVDILLTLTGIAGVAKGLGKVLTKGVANQAANIAAKGVTMATAENAGMAAKVAGRTLQGTAKTIEVSANIIAKPINMVGNVAAAPAKVVAKTAEYAGKGISKGAAVIADTRIGSTIRDKAAQAGNALRSTTPNLAQGVDNAVQAVKSGTNKVSNTAKKTVDTAKDTIKQAKETLMQKQIEKLTMVNSELKGLGREIKDVEKSLKSSKLLETKAQNALKKLEGIQESSTKFEKTISGKLKIEKDIGAAKAKLANTQKKLSDLPSKNLTDIQKTMKSGYEDSIKINNETIKNLDKKLSVVTKAEEGLKKLPEIDAAALKQAKKNIRETEKNVAKEQSKIERLNKDKKILEGEQSKLQPKEGKVTTEPDTIPSEAKVSDKSTWKERREAAKIKMENLKDNKALIEGKLDDLNDLLKTTKNQKRILKINEDIGKIIGDLKKIDKEILANTSLLRRSAPYTIGASAIGNNLTQQYGTNQIDSEWDNLGNVDNSERAIINDEEDLKKSEIRYASKPETWRTNLDDVRRENVTALFLATHRNELLDVQASLSGMSNNDNANTLKIILNEEKLTVDDVVTLQDIIGLNNTDTVNGKDGMIGKITWGKLKAKIKEWENSGAEQTPKVTPQAEQTPKVTPQAEQTPKVTPQAEQTPKMNS